MRLKLHWTLSSTNFRILFIILKDDEILYIYTDDNCYFSITTDDNVVIGDGAMMISSDKRIRVINTNKIIHIELTRSSETIQSLKDSEEE